MEGLKSQNLENINKDNLLHGLDSEGENMPPYLDPDYANFKTMINSNNRGFWDLKYTGEYHKGIYTEISANEILFKQRFMNPKIQWLNNSLFSKGKNPLGITEKQLIEVQKKNIDIVKPKLLSIINGV